MCGEYHTRLKSPSRIVGSPPHVWRIQKSILAAGYKYGITSTCVENTILQLRALLSTRDHLHIRGEYQAEHLPH